MVSALFVEFTQGIFDFLKVLGILVIILFHFTEQFSDITDVIFLGGDGTGWDVIVVVG